jgi:chitodextrinase
MLAKEVEGGRMTDQDRQIQIDTLPNLFSDTMASAKMAWDAVDIMRNDESKSTNQPTKPMKAGDSVTLKSTGKKVTVTKVNPDGSFEYK